MPHDDFAAYCAELIGAAGPVRVKRMFGGHGLYLDDRFVAIVAGDRLYLKTDASTRPAFAAAGGEPFVYEGQGRPVTMSYWTVPAEAMESPSSMRPWATLALQAATVASAPAPRRQRVKPAAAPARARKPRRPGAG